MEAWPCRGRPWPHPRSAMGEKQGSASLGRAQPAREDLPDTRPACPKPDREGTRNACPESQEKGLPHSIQPLVLPDELNELLDPEAELQAALRVKTRQRAAYTGSPEPRASLRPRAQRQPLRVAREAGLPLKPRSQSQSWLSGPGPSQRSLGQACPRVRPSGQAGEGREGRQAVLGARSSVGRRQRRGRWLTTQTSGPVPVSQRACALLYLQPRRPAALSHMGHLPPPGGSGAGQR